jgi:MFS family permease
MHGPRLSQCRSIFFVAIIAFLGTINSSTGDLGVLVPLEHAMLARGVSDDERTRTFARYSLIGALSMAGGSLGAALPDYIADVDRLSALRIMFYIYAVLGLVSIALYRRLPHARSESGLARR